jgi:tetratricopeptide (TPR) repeat protein
MRRAGILGLMAVSSWAQFAPLPQADTPEEFDAYLEVLYANTPAATIAAGEAFLGRWSVSGLRGHVYERQFDAWRRIGDAGKAISAGENALAAAPDNLVVLANLAVVLANQTSDPARLVRADVLARKAIGLCGLIRLPRSIRLEEWERTSASLQSQAQAALGLVANHRGDVAGAVRAFEAAIALAPEPDATQYYRLGMLYRATGNLPAAREKLLRAAGLNEPAIKELAHRELQDLERR